mgnify:CR=1 FL=1
MGKCWQHSILVGGSFKQESFDQLRKYLSNWRDHDSVIGGLGDNGVYENHGGKARNIALFVQDEYQISDPLTMYLGVRYDHFTKWMVKADIMIKITGALTRSLDYDEVSYSEFSPKIAFDYKC